MGSAEGAIKTAARRIGISVDEYRANLAAGMKWCIKCRIWQAVDEFNMDASRGDGRTSVCHKRHVRLKAGPSQRVRRMRLASDEKWCSDCKKWLPSDAVQQGRCREHRNAAARRWYAGGSPAAQAVSGRNFARRRGLEPIPGWWADETRREFSGLCAYGCGRPGNTWDHIWPVSRGGISAPGNLVPACSSCNSSKKASDPTPWVDRGINAFPDLWLELEALAVETGRDEWCAWNNSPWITENPETAVRVVSA